MKFYLPRNLRALERFGREPLDGRTFNELTHANDIDVILSSFVDNGFYFYSKARRHTIVIASRLPSEMRRWVGWHEFAHFLQNYWEPKTIAAGCKIGVQTDAEAQANAFATIATMEKLTMVDPLDYIDTIMGGGIRLKR